MIIGTNYYRIPTVDEMESKKQNLIDDVVALDLSVENIERGFQTEIENSWETESPWDRFIRDTNIHLGKRSRGWLFCWDFHNNKYYSNKEELLNFIRSGRVVDEYGEEWEVEKFIDMALTWEQPNGRYVNPQYRKEERLRGMGSFFDDSRYDDKIIDGLRVSSSTEFS